MKFIKMAVVSGAFCVLAVPAFAAAPNQANIAWMPSQFDNGENIKVVWNMW